MEKIRALAEPRRLEILRIIGSGEVPAGEIAEKFEVTRPAISQHLHILERAGLITQRRMGTKRLFSIRREGFHALSALLEEFWNPKLHRLKKAAEYEERKKR